MMAPEDIDAALEANPPQFATHRHKKRGTEYVLIGYGKMQTEKWSERSGNRRTPDHGRPMYHSIDMREVAIYHSATDPTEIWVRPREEFEDGRFEVIESVEPDPDAIIENFRKGKITRFGARLALLDMGFSVDRALEIIARNLPGSEVEPLYSAATVAALTARAEKAERDYNHECNLHDLTKRRAETAEVRLAATDPKVEALVAAANAAQTALNDWLASYAGEHCSDGAVKAAAERISEFGTIGYIAVVSAKLKEALASLRSSQEG